LLEKHRDHYSHSVYVFALGLAFYANDRTYREAFQHFYHLDANDYETFLSIWGMTTLFHDIGYPFEIAHDEIKSYTNSVWGKEEKDVPYVAYANLDAFLRLTEEEQALLEKKIGITEKEDDINKVLSFWLEKRNGYPKEKTEAVLFGNRDSRKFQDHAYFSTITFFRYLLIHANGTFNEKTMDALTAILLHNSFNKFNMDDFTRPMEMQVHPLSYLLILCDELQDWDRQAYGVKTKVAPQAWNAELEIGDGSATVRYFFDSFVIETPITGDPVVKNSRVTKIQEGTFIPDILQLIHTNGTLKAEAAQLKKDKRSYVYASDSSFINLCDFAKSIHASYQENCMEMDTQFLDESFGSLPLEFKLSNIDQAKSYPEKLELINCFFSDKELDYPMVQDFSKDKLEGDDEGRDDLEFLSREEHVRWVREKLSRGWTYGISYIDPKTKKENTKERNEKKEHKDLVPYDCLNAPTREKDKIAIRNMVPLLYKHGDGIRIYRYRYGRKDDLVIAGVGHLSLHGDMEAIKAKVKDLLSLYDRNYRVVVRTCFAPGADQLIAECADELGLPTKATLPLLLKDIKETDLTNPEVVKKDIEAYIHYYLDHNNGCDFTDKDAMRMRLLLSQTVACKIVPDEKSIWEEPSRHIIDSADKVIALWDGVETPLINQEGKEINRGGTYDCIRMAREEKHLEDKDIHIIKVSR